jgi:hypothetical protein
MPFSAGKQKKPLVLAGIAVWLTFVSVGFGALWKYATTPGINANPPQQWPAHTKLDRRPGHPILLIFLHPECECSRATLGELAILMAHEQGVLDAVALFTMPDSEADQWGKSGLLTAARAIAGVRVIEDRDLRLIRQFGAHTSGQTLLYGTSGRLLFKGGITAIRGHSGDNAGRTAIGYLIHNPIPAAIPVVTRVFGCSLIGE